MFETGEVDIVTASTSRSEERTRASGSDDDGKGLRFELYPSLIAQCLAIGLYKVSDELFDAREETDIPELFH